MAESTWRTAMPQIHMLLPDETLRPNMLRALLCCAALAYCFIGLSAITARFFKSMENVVKHTRKVVEIDPLTNCSVVKKKKVWNYTIADITLLAFGTSFPQISLATIDAIRSIGELTAGGLGPGTLVGSAAFDLFPIHAVCVLVPRAGSLKKISDLGVWLVELFWSFWAYVWLYIILEVWTPKMITLWEALLTVLQFGFLLFHAYAQDKRWPYLSIPLERSERPEEWCPEDDKIDDGNHTTLNVQGPEMLGTNDCRDDDVVDIFSVHSNNIQVYQSVLNDDANASSSVYTNQEKVDNDISCFSIWRQQFADAIVMESWESKKMDNRCSRVSHILWNSVVAPWRFMFAFVPPCHIAHGWVSFICSLIFISGIAYVVTKLTDQISAATGINPYVIAITALASGTSWPDLVASKIAAERQVTADSAIANITCSNSVNIYVGIGVPWLINTTYNFFAYREPLYIDNAAGMSFSLLVFFATSAACIAVLVLRRVVLGAELGGPRLWAWVTAVYFMFLWIIFVILSSLKVSAII